MRRGLVYKNGEHVGTLVEDATGYTFTYTNPWYANPAKAAVSLTLPKTQQEYKSPHLFPFFYNMLSEGVNRALQCRQFKIDENDHFGLLLATAGVDTIGAITIIPEK
jgi:HipA-like protein